MMENCPKCERISLEWDPMRSEWRCLWYACRFVELRGEREKRLREDAGGGEMGERPTIVCLCGSTRFMEAFFAAGWEETLAGKIVLSVGVCKHADADGAHGAEMLGPEVVKRLDELHLRKIDLADEVLILNVGGYIGESTRKELAYARAWGKRVRFLEDCYSAKASLSRSLAEITAALRALGEEEEAR